jgi:hypothetical protein
MRNRIAITAPQARDGKAKLRKKLPLQYPFDRIALAGRALEAMRNDHVDRGEIEDAEECQLVINMLTGGDEHVLQPNYSALNGSVNDDGRQFVFGGQAYYIGTVPHDTPCESCNYIQVDGREAYLTSARFGAQTVMCRGCGLDEARIQKGLL